jgi:hypothetical protein
MDEFSYTNIFATKGIEYIIVIVYFIMFVFFTKALNSSSKGNRKGNGGTNHED